MDLNEPLKFMQSSSAFDARMNSDISSDMNLQVQHWSILQQLADRFGFR